MEHRFAQRAHVSRPVVRGVDASVSPRNRLGPFCTRRAARAAPRAPARWQYGDTRIGRPRRSWNTETRALLSAVAPCMTTDAPIGCDPTTLLR